MSEYTEARKRANTKWDKENKERKKYLSKRSTARAFIRDHMKHEDLSEFINLIEERKINMKKLVNGLNIKIKADGKEYVGSVTDVFNRLFADDAITEEQLNELHRAADPIKAWNDLDIHIGDLGVEFDVDFGGDVEKDFVKVDDLEEVEVLKAQDIIDGDSSTTILI